MPNTRKNKRGKRNQVTRIPRSIPPVWGSADKAPRGDGAQQPHSRIIVKPRIERRKLTYVFDLLTGSSGNLAFYIGTSIPGVAANSSTTGLVSDVLSSDEPNVREFNMYRVKKVEAIFTPLRPITDAPITLYSAYDAINSPASVAAAFLVPFVTKYNDSTRFLSRESFAVRYNVTNPSTMNPMTTISVLQGGWIDIDVLATAPATLLPNMGPGFIVLNGLTSLVATGILRCEVNYLIELKGRQNS